VSREKTSHPLLSASVRSDSGPFAGSSPKGFPVRWARLSRWHILSNGEKDNDEFCQYRLLHIDDTTHADDFQAFFAKGFYKRRYADGIPQEVTGKNQIAGCIIFEFFQIL